MLKEKCIKEYLEKGKSKRNPLLNSIFKSRGTYYGYKGRKELPRRKGGPPVKYF